jgi:hypothetical protein
MVDLDELACRAVAAPPVQPSSLEALEHRVRQRRRRRRLAGALPLLAVAVAAVIGVPRLVADDSDETPVVAGEPDLDQVPAGWSVRQAAGVSVTVPDGWVFTDEDLTPMVSNPRTLWAVGTDPIPGYGGEPCAQQPTAALDHLEPDGVLVVLLERRDGISGFADREDPLWSMRGDRNQSEAQACSSGDFDDWWFSFADEGRGFYMLVAVGPQAGDRIADVERLVNSVTIGDRTASGDGPGPNADETAAERAALEFFGALARSDWVRAARFLESPGSSPVEFGSDIAGGPYEGTEIGRLIESEPDLADAGDLPGLLQVWCERHPRTCTPPVEATALTRVHESRNDYVVEVKLEAPGGEEFGIVRVTVGWFEGERYLRDLPSPPR